MNNSGVEQKSNKQELLELIRDEANSDYNAAKMHAINFVETGEEPHKIAALMAKNRFIGLMKAHDIVVSNL